MTSKSISPGLTRLIPFLFMVIFAWMETVLVAEYVFFSPQGGYAVEVSLENSARLQLPIYRNAITSLEVVGDQVVGRDLSPPGPEPIPVHCFSLDPAAGIQGRPGGSCRRPA